jgi:fructose-specific phosphotransferase system IIA component
VRPIVLASPITTPNLVVVDSESSTQEHVIRELTERLVSEGRVTNSDAFVAEVLRREELLATGIQGGIAIPHAQSSSVTTPSVAVATSESGIPFGAPDGPAHLVFLIAVPTDADDIHLQILAAIARRVTREDFRDALRSAPDSAFIADVMSKEVQQ